MQKIPFAGEGPQKELNTETKSIPLESLPNKGGLDGMKGKSENLDDSHIEIREGEIYILETKHVERAHEFIMKYIAENDKNNSKYLVNIFTRHMPVVNGLYKDEKGICGNVYEITTVSGKNRISPASIGYIKHTISSTAFAEKKPLFVIDCIDIMAMYADKEKVNAMLEELRDIITATKGLGFIIIDPTTYEERELAQIRRFKISIKI